jgi:hypothetical protein
VNITLPTLEKLLSIGLKNTNKILQITRFANMSTSGDVIEHRTLVTLKHDLQVYFKILLSMLIVLTYEIKCHKIGERK